LVQKGFYPLPIDPALEANFRRNGFEIDVVCAGRESGLDFGVDATTPEGRAAQRRAYHSLGVQLRCVHSIGGTVRIMAPQHVPNPRLLEDHQLIQEARGIGFMAGENNNPICLGMTMIGPGITGVAACQSFGDSPSIWFAYVGVHMNEPFVITSVLKVPWFMASRRVVPKYFEFVRGLVESKGIKYVPDCHGAWMSPAGRNIRLTEDEVLDVMAADVGDDSEYITLDNSGDPAAPHTLDVTAFTVSQLLEAGLPDKNLVCLDEDTATALAPDGTFRWDSEQRDGDSHGSVHNIVAGVVRRLNW
jgi:hypothetical protein